MKKRIIILLITVIICIFYGYKVWRVNTDYPTPEVIVISRGNTHEIDEHVDMVVNEFKWIENDELKSKIGSQLNSSAKYFGIIVSVTYKNKSEEKKLIATYNCNIEYLGYSNGIEPNFYNQWNDEDMEIELNKNEEKTVWLTYVVGDFQFNKQDWKNIKQLDWYLTSSRYPVKTKWLLK